MHFRFIHSPRHCQRWCLTPIFSCDVLFEELPPTLLLQKHREQAVQRFALLPHCNKVLALTRAVVVLSHSQRLRSLVTGGCPSDRLVTRGSVLFSVQTSEFNPTCLHIYPQSHLHVQAFIGIFHPFPGAVGSNDTPHNAKCDYCHEAPAEEKRRRQTLLHTN